MTNWTTHSPARSRKAQVFARISIMALVVVFGLLGVGLMIRNHFAAQGESRYQEAVAGLDQKDPRWRWEDILADRAAVPDDQNAAPIVRATAALLPPGSTWTPRRSPPPVPLPAGGLEQGFDQAAMQAGMGLAIAGVPGPSEQAGLPPASLTAADQPTLEEEIADRSSAERLDRGQIEVLRGGLERLRPALQEARPLAERPTGRYEIAWRPDFISTLLPHLEQARSVCRLLLLDAALAAEDGDPERALVSCRASFNAGRSIGDEPTLISLLVRIACTNSTVRTLERVLAQGTCSSESLAAWQRILEEEATQPLLRRGLRAERAAYSEVIGLVASGELSARLLAGTRSGPSALFESIGEWSYIQPNARSNQAVYLEMMTRAIEAEKLPPAEQRQVFQSIETEVRSMKASAPHMRLVTLVMPAVLKIAEAADRNLAELRCAQVALAAERYRLAHGDWPKSLQQLVGEFLNAVPSDPFGEGPLHLRRTEVGLVVYSVGRDGVDDGGNVTRTLEHPQPPDLGFRLWDPAKRRQPPAARPGPGQAGP